MLITILFLLAASTVAMAIFTALLGYRIYRMDTEIIQMRNALLELEVYFHTKELTLQIEREIPGIQLSCDLSSTEGEPHRIHARFGDQELTVDVKWLGGFIRAWIENEDVAKAMREASLDYVDPDHVYSRGALFDHMRRRLRYGNHQETDHTEKEN